MPMRVLDRDIQRIHLIDDAPEVRQSYKDVVEDMGVEGIEVSSAISNVDTLLNSFDPYIDGVVCDYQLTNKKYSPVNGDVIGAKLYRAGIPFILCTHFQPLSAFVGPKRREIPIVVTPADLTEERVTEAFRLCLLERRGQYSLWRQPIRTLVRVEGLQDSGAEVHLSVEVPAWKPGVGIQFSLPRVQLPNVEELVAELQREGAARLSAEVNIGAENLDDLYFLKWRLL